MQESPISDRMQKVLDLVVSEVGAIRTGRATPALVEKLEVAVYGGQQRLKVQELATITAPDPYTLVVDPWDKSIAGEISKGILAANVGMNPSLDGEIIRISFPPFTTEDREKYIKLLSTKLEGARVMIRQIRAEIMHDVKKNFEGKELTEDEKFNQEKSLQGLTDEFIGKIDDMGERKKTELREL